MSDLVKVMFPDSEIAKKFACKRTKTTHIINQALGPHFDNKATDLCRSNKFSVMIDESNDQGDQKLLTILVRVYDQDVKKISTKFLGIPRCNIGTADSIFSTLNQVFIDRDILWKNCVGFSSDNCNVMVGKNNSVLSRVKEANPNVFDMGCVCHLANICVQKAVKTLALPVDDLLTEVFYHFQRSTKRQETYKEFLEFTNTDALKIIRHCQTRWLSLEKCVSRLLHQWSALKSYFTSHEDVEKSGRVKRVSDWLNDPLMWLYYGFLEFVLPFMNEFNVMFQGGESMIGYLHIEMTRLLRKLMGRFTTTKVIRDATDLTKVPFQVRKNQHDDERLAVGWRVREYLDNNDVSTEITKKFFSDVRVFYEKMVATMVAKFPFKDATLQSLSFLKPDLRDTISPEEVANLFDRFVSGSVHDRRRLVEEHEDYLLTPEHELPKQDHLETYWVSVGEMKLHTGQERFRELSKIALILLSLPHSNADSERSFSILRKIQADSRSNLAQETIQNLMSTKMNNLSICSTFCPSNELIRQGKAACTEYNHK